MAADDPPAIVSPFVKDNVPVQVDAVVWYRVSDPVKSVIEVQDVHEAVTQVALTMLRDVLGRHSLDDLLKEKDTLSEELRNHIDRATHPWGIEVQMARGIAKLGGAATAAGSE